MTAETRKIEHPEGGSSMLIRPDMGAPMDAYLEALEVDPRHIQQIEEQLRASEEPYLTEDEREARQLETEATEGWGRLQAAFAHAEMDLGGSVTQTEALPTWEGEVLQVPETVGG